MKNQTKVADSLEDLVLQPNRNQSDIYKNIENLIDLLEAIIDKKNEEKNSSETV